jgi:4,4'-diapolycopenoate synthase
MQRARTAQAAWTMKTVRDRCEVLSALRGQIAAQSHHIVDVLTHDTGKTPLDALSGDVLVTLEQLRYNEENVERLLRTRTPPKPSFLFTGARFIEIFEPRGVVLVYAPANYPFQLSVIPMATALAAGNAVIVKCSEKTPRTAQLIVDLCCAAEIPQDLVQVVCNAPETAGALIDAAPDMVFFTGSSAAGRHIAARCAERLIPAVLELGGKDAALVFADCNFKRTVEGVTYGAFSNAGQVCVGIKRLYVEEPMFHSFLAAMATRASKLRIGASRDSDLGVLPSGAARERFLAQVQDAIEKGATLHLPALSNLTGCEPVILSNVPPGARLSTEEVFGPVVCVAPFESESDAIALANESEFALSCSVWTGDIARGQRVAARMTAGTCAVNDVIRNIANPYASFGGNRQSGYGRYHGPQGLLAFSRTKSVMTVHDYSSRERHWFPFTKRTFRMVHRMLAVRHRKGSLLHRLRHFLLPALPLVFLLSPVSLRAENAAHLRIDVKLLPGSHGDIAYLIFASKDGFPNNKSRSLRGGFVAVPNAQANNVEIDAGEMSPGHYAVSVYQDMNGNHKLDKNMVGVPSEPVGASNNPRTRMGPPKFSDCAFDFGSVDQTISIELVH